MQVTITFLCLLVALKPVMASCTWQGQGCVWRGTSPFCRSYQDRSGTVCTDYPDYSYTCTVNTDDESIYEL
ncbi:hypothetical protein QBC38DRAFT_492699 [Podospora fimiseda]|uniref:CBM1 domain-containing protein n=1 Tax=Podospora fimiseda TaxID=252190 RepID=A0AAN6YL65_9PEZI|nr:hypothetical protein QBC38DRAFT_492699 [Podospora fimiseda]